MHPVGLALVFLMFWSLAAVGAFLVLHGIRNLKAGSPSAFQAMVSGATVLLGMTMIGAGVYAAYVALWGG